ncbi:hypothetical protein D3C85_1584350 [compost metagenome]
MLLRRAQRLFSFGQRRLDPDQLRADPIQPTLCFGQCFTGLVQALFGVLVQRLKAFDFFLVQIGGFGRGDLGSGQMLVQAFNFR